MRDTLFDHIASISTPKLKDERKVEKIISSENNLPAKPKILDNKGLFNKSNVNESLIISLNMPIKLSINKS